MEENLDNDMQPKINEKSKKLQEKVQELVERVENEQNPIKRHLLSFRIKMIISKIQREIDIQNIEADYEQALEDLRFEKEIEEANSERIIPHLTKKIKLLENEIWANEEYDYKSSNFMYPQSHVQKVGGFDKLTEKLEKSTDIDSQLAANKMKQIADKRQELEALKEELENEKANLDNSEINLANSEKGLKKDKNQLILKKKFNIFDRVKTFFNNMKDEFAEYKEERKEAKELKAKQKENEQLLLKMYKMQQEELKNVYKVAKQQADENRGKQKMEEFKKQMQSYTPIIDHKDEVVVEVAEGQSEQQGDSTNADDERI